VQRAGRGEPPNHTQVLLPAALRSPQHEHDPPVKRYSREDLFFQVHHLPLGCVKRSISLDDRQVVKCW
jgi:hypothetical protein